MADRQGTIKVGEDRILARHKTMAWHLPHRGNDGRVFNAARDDVLIDHPVSLALAVSIDERSVFSSASIT
jgi:hypothetical protein